MLPGTPLILITEYHPEAGPTNETAPDFVHGHALVLFHNWKKEQSVPLHNQTVHVYNPRLAGVLPVRLDKLVTFDGSALIMDSIDMYRWQDIIPEWFSLSHDWQVAVKPWRRPDPQAVYIDVKHHIQNAIDDYAKVHGTWTPK